MWMCVCCLLCTTKGERRAVSLLCCQQTWCARSGLNAVPILLEWQRDPDNLYLLRLAVGGLTNPLPNINTNGANSMGFHLNPNNLRFDPYSGDWGVGFFATARHIGGVFVQDPDLGVLCFLCDVAPAAAASRDTTATVVLLRDAWRKKLYIGPLGLQLVSEAGTISSVAVADTTITVTFGDVATQPLVSVLRLRAEQPSVSSGHRPALVLQVEGGPQTVRGAWEIQPEPKGKTTTVVITFKKKQS